MKNRFSVCQNLRLPLIQAPMAGLTDATLVIHACRMGLIGSLGAGTMEPEAIRTAIHAIRAGTQHAFNINLFIIDEHKGYVPDPPVLAARRQYLKTLTHEENLDTPIPQQYAPSFPDQFAVLLDEAPPIASFTFGILSSKQVAALQRRGVRVIGTATSSREAKAWEQAGADAVCVQGIEAGGHRGGFLDTDFAGIGLMALIPACRAAVDIPIIAAGGIMTGGGILSALLAGADAVQMGTAFLCCDEAPTPAPYRQALLAGRYGEETILTRAFSGRPARGLSNAFMHHFADKPVAPYPVQNALTQPLRKWATARGDREHMSVWAGQGLELIKSASLEALVAQLEREFKQAQQTIPRLQ